MPDRCTSLGPHLLLVPCLHMLDISYSNHFLIDYRCGIMLSGSLIVYDKSEAPVKYDNDCRPRLADVFCIQVVYHACVVKCSRQRMHCVYERLHMG